MTKQHKILVNTFKDNWNGGEVIPAGVIEREIVTEPITTILRDGCLSGEIVRNQVVKWICVEGRQFIVKDLPQPVFDRQFDVPKHEVYLPWKLAKKLCKAPCPCCGKI